MNEKANSVINTVPAAKALHHVPLFDPLKLLRKTTSAKTGEKVLKLDLRYKKMWFRLTYPRGRMFTNPLRITDQMAIFEAQLYADRDDPAVFSQFTSCHTRSESGPQYIRAAQDEALNEALDNAGFGIQLADLVEGTCGSGYGSEVLLSQVEALLREPEYAAPSEQTVPAQPVVPAPPTPAQTVTEAPVPQPVEVAAPAVETAPVQVVEPSPMAAIPDDPVPVHDAELVEDVASKPATEPQPNVSAPSASAETANILQMLGGIPTAAVEPAIEPATEPKQTERPTVVAFPHTEEPVQTVDTVQQSEPPAAAEPVVEAGVSYTEDMTVDEIRARMTAEQAKTLTVSFGPNKGWTLGQVLERRPSSLKFYALVSPDAGNALKAGSFLLLDELSRARAG